MFKSFWGSQEQQDQPPPQENPSNSWYRPLPPTSQPVAPPGSSTSVHSRFANKPQSLSPVSPSEAAGFVFLLKDKSLDELRKLLSDKDAYYQFLLSLEQVKTQNKIRDELCKEIVQLASENLEKQLRNGNKESDEEFLIYDHPSNHLSYLKQTIALTCISKLQCRINELEAQKDAILMFYSPSSILQRLQDAMKKNEEKSGDCTSSWWKGRLKLELLFGSTG